MDDKKEKLLTELKKYEDKVLQLKKDCAEFKAGGSRYGDEYGEIQIKVYADMIDSIKSEIKRLERKT
ncbi:hypothetical protein KKD37_02350 [Patescibacteria group bacterium]|nr:hypothetical protein [Patescibacteria group bacterium]